MSSTITALTSGGGLAMAGDTSGQLELKTNNGTTAVTIDASQNVGIGTSSPSARLNVVASDSSNAGIAAAVIRQNGAAGNNGMVVDVTNSVLNYVADFRIANSSVMRIDESGNLLVGATSTSYSPTTGVQLLNLSTNTLGVVTVGHASGVGGGSYFASFGYAGSVIGAIVQNGTTAVAYNTSSDYRLKDTIAPMTGALDKVAQLKPCTYVWKASGELGQGFIAHELAEVVPDCVTGEKDAVDEDGNPKYQGIDTSFLVATLTAAIQELKTQVDAQALEIQALKGVA